MTMTLEHNRKKLKQCLCVESAVDSDDSFKHVAAVIIIMTITKMMVMILFKHNTFKGYSSISHKQIFFLIFCLNFFMEHILQIC